VNTVFDTLSDFFVGRPSSASAVDEIERQESLPLPEDYKRLLLVHGPGEGFVGEQYFILWDASEIIQFNKEYESKKYAPDFLLIGSNGGGEGFAYDCRGKDKPVVIMPFIGMSVKTAVKIAENITVFFEKMKSGHAPIL